ncbi:MAG: acyltransferase family protein [Aeromonadaceae bacterium]
MRISSIECGRVWAIMAVMVIHISPFANPFDPSVWNEPGYIYLAGLINQLPRFTVPFFFLCAGYFLQPKLCMRAPLQTAWHYCRPLLLLWLVWSVLYMIIPFDPVAAWQQGYRAAMAFQWQLVLSDPLNQWWVGGMVHLWFLPALMLAVWIVALCQQWHRPGWALALGGGLYLLALLGGSYAKPLLGAEWAVMTRNGPFFSLLFVALGFMIRLRQWQLGSALAMRLLVLGAVGYLLEGLILHQLWQIPFGRHDFLFSSLPWALGLFCWLLANPHLGRGSWLERQAPKVLGLYCLHMLLVAWLFPLSMKWMSPYWELVKPLVVFGASLALYALLARLPGAALLLRGQWTSISDQRAVSLVKG